MEVFIGRQPIFDRTEKVFAFELLYRNGDMNIFPDIDGDFATTEVLINSFLTIGVEELSNGRPCFINFTENLLFESIFDTFNPKHIIIEILENVNITPVLIDKLRQLKRQGFKMALDDFVLTNNIVQYKELFSLIDFIKVDFIATSVENRLFNEKWIKTNFPHIRLLAEKIETREEFEQAKESGYQFFQGYFFSKPQIIHSNDIPTNLAHYFRIIRMISEKNANISHIANLIEHDVALSFKLLKLINASSSKNKVRSIKHAIVVLGLTELHQWIYILALRESMRGETGYGGNALLASSLFRAKFCELLAKHKKKSNSAEYFLVGMFSMIEALLQRPLSQIIQHLPLSIEVIQTLSKSEETEMSIYLEFTVAFDQLKWVEILKFTDELNIPEDDLHTYYNKAMQWSNQIT
ncbi:MAG: EAL and HDOD domain-containing protein [Paenisporosarcina sp.]